MDYFDAKVAGYRSVIICFVCTISPVSDCCIHVRKHMILTGWLKSDMFKSSYGLLGWIELVCRLVCCLLQGGGLYCSKVEISKVLNRDYCISVTCNWIHLLCPHSTKFCSNRSRSELMKHVIVLHCSGAIMYNYIPDFAMPVAHLYLCQ